MARRIVAGNWKMHLELTQARELFARIVDDKDLPEDMEVIVIPPFPFIHPLYRELPPDSNIGLGAQNCHQEEEGAFTGEVAAPMLASVGAKYCIVGHSERRRDQGEDDSLVLQKVRRLLDAKLTPIICIGESLEEREKGEARERIGTQLEKSLLELTPEEGKACILAYEPIWAIGTGHTASPEQAQEMHATVRERIEKAWGPEAASEIPILYGGSCKASNAQDLFAQKDVDGGLIGGASLKADGFRSIIRSFP